MDTKTTTTSAHAPAHSAAVDKLFKAGAHYGLSKARRHPSARQFVFGAKNKVEIFDLDKTAAELEKAKKFVKTLAAEGKQLLFVGGKAEARDSVKAAAAASGMPYVAGRWIGGTITNFAQVRSRVDKMLSLQTAREKGELGKYTKKERLLIDREIDNLLFYFDGIVPMVQLPKALFVIDPKREHIAVTEAKKAGIPVVALANTDCNLALVDIAIPANDAALASVRYFLNEIAAAYNEGKALAPKKPAVTAAPVVATMANSAAR